MYDIHGSNRLQRHEKSYKFGDGAKGKKTINITSERAETTVKF